MEPADGRLLAGHPAPRPAPIGYCPACRASVRVERAQERGRERWRCARCGAAAIASKGAINHVQRHHEAFDPSSGRGDTKE